MKISYKFLAINSRDICKRTYTERHYKLAKSKKIRIQRRKKRQHSVIAKAWERIHGNDMRSFYATVNGVLHKTAPGPDMCNYREGNLLTVKTIMVETRCKEYQPGSLLLLYTFWIPF